MRAEAQHHLLGAGRRAQLLAAQAALLCLVACADRVRSDHPAQDSLPPLGLYQVTNRLCENPLHEPDNCPRLQYVELTHVATPRRAQDPAVLIFWFAPEVPQADYTYEVWPLHGRFTDRNRCLLHDEGAVRDWFVLQDDQIHEYDFQGFTSEQRQQIRLKSRGCRCSKCRVQNGSPRSCASNPTEKLGLNPGGQRERHGELGHQSPRRRPAQLLAHKRATR